ncbi:response regulator [Candidatus Kaiserbacteria bacterium]|nr:response regulator [Candidatus Kaiserbacteria bacterium]
MPNQRILLADNDPEFLNTCAEFLVSAGYKVVKAPDLEGARRVLEESWVHLAILDLRLINDEDEKDMSGLVLASESTSPVPKIMLTKYQTWEAVRESLGPVIRDTPPAAGFVAKQEGLEELLRCVRRTFTKRIHFNWNLAIKWNETHPLSFSHLASLIQPSLQGDRLADRAGELKDLFRRLFYEKSQITIERLLWQRGGRVALTVFTFAPDKPFESFVVVCGPSAHINDDIERYRKYAPTALETTSTATLCVLENKAETTHFAAYTLAGIPLESIQTLAEFYRTNPERKSLQAVAASLQATFVAWHKNQRVPPEHEATESRLYREKISLEELGQTGFEERINTLQGEAAAHGLALDLAGERLKLQLVGGQTLSYQNPLSYLFGPTLDNTASVACVITPGTLTTNSILVVPGDRAWLTDFSDVGPAPICWSFVALEAAIRFGLVESDDLLQLHEMERRLTEADKLGQLDTRDVDKPIRLALQSIELVRRAASELAGRDARSYHMGLLFQAASRVATFQPGVRRTRREVVAALHVLLAASMICERVLKASQDDTATDPVGIRIDVVNQIVLVEDKQIHPTPTEFKILVYFYEHAGQLCSRKNVFEHVWDETYDRTNSDHNSRLDANINRLRQKLEPDNSAPRYLFVERGVGYRLFTEPKK